METTSDNATQSKPTVVMVGEINRDLLKAALKKMVLRVMQDQERHDDKTTEKTAEVPVLRKPRVRSRTV